MLNAGAYGTSQGTPDKHNPVTSSLLISAAFHLDAEKVDQLLSSGNDPNVQGSGGITPLTASLSRQIPIKSGFLNGLGSSEAIFKRQEIVEKLLAHGANPDTPLSSGITPLMLASRDGASSVVSALLAHHAAINTMDKAGKNALDYAVANNHWNVFRKLVRAGAEYKSHKTKSGDTLLAEAMESNAWTVAKWLIEHKAGINTPYSGTTPLITSIIRHADPITYSLLNHGADPNLRGRDNGPTPLIAAVRLRDINAIRLLMHHGADPKLKDDSGHSALFYADRTGNPLIKKLTEN